MAKKKGLIGKRGSMSRSLGCLIDLFLSIIFHSVVTYCVAISFEVKGGSLYITEEQIMSSGNIELQYRMSDGVFELVTPSWFIKKVTLKGSVIF